MGTPISSEYRLSLKEASERLPVSATLLYDLVRKKQIPSIRIAKKYFVREADINHIKAHGLPQATPVVGRKEQL